MMVFFQTRLEKILIWQKFSQTWEPDFNVCGDVSMNFTLDAEAIQDPFLLYMLFKLYMHFHSYGVNYRVIALPLA